ncbi:DNA/RNA helicase, partial [Bacillus subtilis]
MKVGLYVCQVREGWKMILSLDIRVDVAWWLEGVSGQRVLRWLLLGRELPLSQASWMVENFEMERGMDQWGGEHWKAYM